MDDFRSNSPGHSKAPVLYSNPHLKNKESANHWSIVCKMELDGTYVNLKVYTWGRTVRYRMLIEQFLKIFNGYVLGRFPDRN